MTTSDTGALSPEFSLLKALCKGLDDKKGGDLKLISVGDISSVTDYIIVATALAEPHLRALRIAAEQVLDAAGVKIASIDTRQESGWLIVDAYHVMVHLFTAPMREKYALEQLWRDGTQISVPDLISDKPVVVTTAPKPRAKPAKTRPAKARPAKGKAFKGSKGAPKAKGAKPAKSAKPAPRAKKK